MCELSCVKPSFKSLKSIGNYSLTGCQLGKGSFARVELAKHGITGLKVALKIFDPSKINDENSKSRLYREASILKQLRHNNIIHIYETLRYGDIYCLVTEVVLGGNLKAYITQQKNGVLRNDVARKLFKQLTLAVFYLHTNGIVHRDLKTDNILLDKNHEIIKLADFGLSNKFKFDQLLQTHCGSPEYAAPELYNRDGYHGPAVDIWSMGIVLFAMLMGKLPFSPEKKTLNAKEELLIQLGKGYTMLHRHTTRKLSIGAQYLLENTLESDPKKRLTIHNVVNSSWLGKDGEKNINLTTERKLSVDVDNEVKQKTIDLLGISISQLGDLTDRRRCDAVSATYNILLDSMMNTKVDTPTSVQCKPQNPWCKRNGSAGVKPREMINPEMSFSKNNCRVTRSCSIPSPRTKLRRKDTSQLRVMGRKTSESKVNEKKVESVKDARKSHPKENTSRLCKLQGFMSTKETRVTSPTQSNIVKHANTVPTKNRHQEIIKQILSNATDNPVDINRIRHLVTKDLNNSTMHCKSALQCRRNQSALPHRNISTATKKMPQTASFLSSSDQSKGIGQCFNDLSISQHSGEKEIFENENNDVQLASKVKEELFVRSNSPFMARMMSHRVAMPMASASVFSGHTAEKCKDYNNNNKEKKRCRSVPIKKYVDTQSIMFNVDPIKMKISENKMNLNTKKMNVPDNNLSVTTSPITTPYQTPCNSRPNRKCINKIYRTTAHQTSSLQATYSTTKTQTNKSMSDTLSVSKKQIPHRSKLQSKIKTVESEMITNIDTLNGSYNENIFAPTLVESKHQPPEKVWCDSYRESINEWYRQKNHTDDQGLALVRKVYYNIDGAIKESNTRHCKTDLQYRLGIARNGNVYNRR